jgi:acetyltransferase
MASARPAGDGGVTGEMGWGDRLDRLFRPRSVAVVGASTNASFVSSILFSLIAYGFQGRIAAVNPRYDRVLDAPCYPSVEDVPGDLDLVVVGVAAQRVPGILEQCERKGVGGVCVVTSGFGEVAAEAGADRQAEIAAWAARTGIPVTGPNCLGLLNAHERMIALPPYWESVPAGAVGMAFQSGMMSGAMTLPIVQRGMGLSLAITTGNEAAIENADVIRYLAEDDVTRVIATFSEQIKSPAKLIVACEAAAEAGKPVVMLKVGRSEGARRAARAHTGSLVGADDVVDAALRKLGVTRVSSIDELVETVALFHARKLPRGNGVAVISVSGGVGSVLSDQAAELGVTFPPLPDETAKALTEIVPEFGSVGNPLDITGQGVFETRMLDASLDALATAESIDVVVHARGWPAALDRESPVGKALERAVALHPEILFLVMSLSGGKLFASSYPHTPCKDPFSWLDGVPFLQGSDDALRAIASLLRYAEFQRQRTLTPRPLRGANIGCADIPLPRAGEGETGLLLPSPLEGEGLGVRGPWGSRARLTPPEIARRARDLVRAAGGRALTERESKEVLALYGMPVTREILARSADDAVGAADMLGWPVALKVESPDLLHKTDAGAVLLNVEDADALLEGYEEIVANARAAQPDATIHGVLIQEMAPRGIEAILGMLHDPSWGPAVAVGIGGTLVEVLKDRQLLLPPIDAGEARAALGALRAARLFDGVRGAPPSDVAALTDALVRFSELCQDLAGEVAEIDVNPLLVLPKGQGVLALDALIVPRAAG